MKLTEKTLKKMIVEAIESNPDLFPAQFRATEPDTKKPDPLDDIFRFIDSVGDAALEKMGKTHDDFYPQADWDYSEITNKIVYATAGDIKKVAGEMSDGELLSILQGLMPMLVDAVVNDKRVKALFPRKEEPKL